MNIIDLMKNYDGKTVVDSVSFEIPKGKVLAMIGPNGAGKSCRKSARSISGAKATALPATERTIPVKPLMAIMISFPQKQLQN